MGTVAASVRKPLECWSKLKEFNRRKWERVASAREQGKVLISGHLGAGPRSLFMGLEGGAEFLEFEGFAATNANSGEVGVQCIDAAERMGFPVDTCSYLRGFVGSMLLNKSFLGHFPRPDLAFNYATCPTHYTHGEFLSERLGIPHFEFESPHVKWQAPQHSRDYFIEQCHQTIDWLMKATGRRYDQDKAIEAWILTKATKKRWDQITDLQMNVPAPMDEKTMLSMMVPALHAPYEKEALEIYDLAYAELKDRAERKVAWLDNERLRLWRLFGNAQWHSLGDYRYLEKFGAVFVGSAFSVSWGAKWRLYAATGSLDYPDYWGKDPRDFDEMLEQIANWCLCAHLGRIDGCDDTPLRQLDEFKIDGALWFATRACQYVIFMDARRQSLDEIEKKSGVRCLEMEGSIADKKEYNETYVHDALETWVKTMQPNPRRLKASI